MLTERSGPGGEDRYEAQARQRSEERLRRQRSLMAPGGWAVMVIVAVTSADGHPAPALHGAGAGVTVAVCVYVLGLAVLITEHFAGRGLAAQFALTATIGAAGVALSALQPQGASELGASAAVWMAITRLPLRPGLVIAAGVTIGLGLASALSGSTSEVVLAELLLCGLLGMTAHLLKQSRESQDRTELLLAELQSARDAQAEAAATQERARIAGELHDVLAHSLSGAAIQLQGARVLAERRGAQPDVRAAIERASELVKDGLADARRAVSTLRGDLLPALGEVGGLVDSFRKDLGVGATLRIEGQARALSAEASLALYRGAQEALTNIARYAPRAAVLIVLRYGPDATTLSVEDRIVRAPAETRGALGACGPADTGGGLPSVGGGLPGLDAGLPRVGGGRGLEGMRERVQRAGGRMDAGPTGEGWRVELQVPA